MKKKSYFEVSSVVNRWLTVGLVLVIVSLMLSQWSSTFTAASDAIAGSFGKALNTFMRTAVGNGVVSVLFGVGHVLLLEFFRRGMRRSGDRFGCLSLCGRCSLAHHRWLLLFLGGTHCTPMLTTRRRGIVSVRRFSSTIESSQGWCNSLFLAYVLYVIEAAFACSASPS